MTSTAHTVIGPWHAATSPARSRTIATLTLPDTGGDHRADLLPLVSWAADVGDGLIGAVLPDGVPTVMQVHLLADPGETRACLLATSQRTGLFTLTDLYAEDAQKAARRALRHSGVVWPIDLPVGVTLRAELEASGRTGYQLRWAGGVMTSFECALPQDLDDHQLHGCHAREYGPWFCLCMARDSGALADYAAAPAVSQLPPLVVTTA